MLSALVALAPALSVTCTVKLDVPGAEGVPVMLPEALSDSPAGSAPAVTAQLIGGVPPLADRVC
jgi:hypothetical protein